MTKFEECTLMAEEIDISINNLSKCNKITEFISKYQNEYWLHIDELRKMLDDLYDSVMEEVCLINYMRENNITAVDYETGYLCAKERLEFINKVKELFSME